MTIDKRMESSLEEALIDYLSQYVTESRQQRLEEVLSWRTRHITVVLEDVYQPHNASAVLRSCEIFGIQHVHVIEKRNPFRANRAIALGAGKWLTVHRYSDETGSGTRDTFQTLRAKGYHLAAMTLRDDAVHLDELNLQQPIALCLGTEKEGLSEEAHGLAESFVRLPMFGFTQSFNVSVTAALALHTLTQRLHASDVDWQLDVDEQRTLKLQWLVRSVRRGELLVQRYIERHGIAASDVAL